MLRNYLAAALRNLVRNKLYAAINIAGLVAGFTVAVLIAAFVRAETTYDRWIPGHERTFGVLLRAFNSDSAPTEWNTATIDMAQLLKLEFPQIIAATRLRITAGLSLRHGDVDAAELLYWADANVFEVLPLPAIAGDLRRALSEPDSIVITRRIARKYFGEDAPLGGIIEINHKYPMRVTAVLEDLPPNTHLNTEIIASGRAAYSQLALLDAAPPRAPDRPVNLRAVYTYIRLQPGADIEALREAMPAFIKEHAQDVASSGAARRSEPVFVALADMHLTRFGVNPMRQPGSAAANGALVTVAASILILAAVNFTTLMTARANRRAIEIGVRKVSGAVRSAIAFQFMGETLIYVAICLAVAVALAEIAAPGASTYFQAGELGRVFGDPLLGLVLISTALTVALLAGAYPAFVLSAFRPAAVLKGAAAQDATLARVRRWLVTIQFAILIGLLITTGIVLRQAHFAMNDGLRFDKEQVLLINAIQILPSGTGCRSSFRTEVEALPGVSAVSCSALAPLTHYSFSRVPLPGGGDLAVALNPVDFGFFEMYGLTPLAGRLFSSAFGGDAVVSGAVQPTIIINEEAVRRLALGSPEQAIGQMVPFARFDTSSNGQITAQLPAEVIGVVRDFPIGALTAEMVPTIFYVDPKALATVHVKLGADAPAEVLSAIGERWAAHTDGRPPTYGFLDQRIQEFYHDVDRQSRLLAVLSGTAVLLGCLGLFGLSALTAESRTKEIGIRKSMGATRRDILCLLLWQFAKPVLWANVIAWPVAYVLMQRWLEGFAYHIDLAPWMFLAASALALIIALATVIGHALLVARAHPVTALRYE